MLLQVPGLESVRGISRLSCLWYKLHCNCNILSRTSSRGSIGRDLSWKSWRFAGERQKPIQTLFIGVLNTDPSAEPHDPPPPPPQSWPKAVNFVTCQTLAIWRNFIIIACQARQGDIDEIRPPTNQTTRRVVPWPNFSHFERNHGKPSLEQPEVFLKTNRQNAVIIRSMKAQANSRPSKSTVDNDHCVYSDNCRAFKKRFS